MDEIFISWIFDIFWWRQHNNYIELLESLLFNFCICIYHFFLFFLRQKSMCLPAACSLNFLPHPGHCTLSSATGYSYLTSTPFITCICLRSISLYFFHLGTSDFFVSWSFDLSFFFSNSASLSVFLTSNGFLFSWNTFWHTLLCLSRAFTLNFRPQP